MAEKQNNCAKLSKVVVAGCATAAILFVDQTWAQSAGPKGSLTVSPRLQTINETGRSSDRDDEGTSLTTGLDLRFNTTTRAQSLGFDLNTNLAYDFSNTDKLEIDDTRARLDYQLRSARSEFRFGTNYRRAEVDDTIFDENLDDDIIIGTGLREIFGFDTGLTLGRDTPLTLGLDYSFSKSDYSNTTDPNLVDSDTQRVSARFAFRISPVLTSTLSLSRRERDEVGPFAEDNVRNEVDLSGSYDISPSTQVRAGINYNDDETTEATGAVRSNDGPGFSLGASRNLPNGQISADYAVNETINGARGQFAVGRSFSLPRADISLSLGATRLENMNFRPLVNATVGFDMDAFSRLSVNLSQSADVSDNDLESIRTRLAVNYNRDLLSVSSLSASFQIANRDEVGVGASDENFARLSLQYRHALDRNWNVLSGYSFSRSRQEGEADRDVSRLFIGLERRFDFLP